MERFLSLDDFKKWISEQKSENVNKISRLVGLKVESKLTSPKRLAKNIISYDGEIDDIASEFCEYGGTITEVEDVSFLIEVDSGTFTIHRCFVRKQESD